MRVGSLVIVKTERKGPEAESNSAFVIHSADIGPLNYIITCCPNYVYIFVILVKSSIISTILIYI